MKSPKLIRLTVVFALGAFLLQACGGDDGSIGNGGGTGAGNEDGNGGQGAVSAEAFAASVCGAMQDWVTGITDSSSSFTDIPADASIEERKAALESWAAELVQLTQDMVGALQAAGVPDVDGGQAIADSISGAFDRALTGFETLADDVAALPTDDVGAFVDASSEIGTSITTALTAAATSVSSLSEPELNAAFAGNPDCTNFAGT
jgi:hypothetical protein